MGTSFTVIPYYTRNDDFAESNVFVVVVTLLDDD